jgi:hypothetical protein
MRLFNQSSSASRPALVYITVGALVVVWTGVWYVHLFNNPPEMHSAYYWCTGFLVTGVTLVCIGLGLDRIGRLAGQADLPPEAVPFVVVNPQLTAAVPAPSVAPANATPAVVLPNGQLLVSPLPGATGWVPGAGGAPPRQLPK